MNVLFVATRSPWPSVDGGRLLMAQTIAGLRGRGHRVTLVAPVPHGTAPGIPPGPDDGDGLRLRFVPVRRRGWIESVVRGWSSHRPTAIERQWHPSMARAVASSLSDGIDVVHVQQLHALVHADPIAGRSVPIVLRAENVESDLWQQTMARAMGRAAGWWPASRLARWERAALERVTSTAAVSPRDAAVLRRLAPLAAVDVVRIPMPAVLPAGERLAGDPAIVLLASAWRPNRDGASWFLGRLWPEIAASLPAARLHVFGGLAGASRGPGVEVHSRPGSSIDAFPEGALAVVPVRIASGANVRILEAWARGLPVVATPIAAGGVAPGSTAGAEAGEDAAVAIASTAGEFAAAFRRLTEPLARAHAVAAGRAALAAHHDPDAMAAGLERVYEAAIRATPWRGQR